MKVFLIYWYAKLFGTTITKHEAVLKADETSWEQSFCEHIDLFFLGLTDYGDILRQIRYEFFSAIGYLVGKVNDWVQQTWIYRFTH